MPPAPTTVRGAGVVNEIFYVERELNSMCRDSADDAKLQDAICNIRDQLAKAATKRGYCYGMKGQIGADMRWHKCTRESLR